ncbi:hypothetical protein ACFCZ1_28205 [Streptomyces sp. NPDC056224]|uniref:hypothetical protein n=1 Tax=Streptomyces sp. NPDC056224 TaxID=3345750 RepID=UPI0035D7FCEB
MCDRCIRGNTSRKRRSLTKAETRAAPSPELVGRDFTAAESGTKLVSDITYPLADWWYLAMLLDLATREVIGYEMADHHHCRARGRRIEHPAGVKAFEERGDFSACPMRNPPAHS